MFRRAQPSVQLLPVAEQCLSREAGMVCVHACDPHEDNSEHTPENAKCDWNSYPALGNVEEPQSAGYGQPAHLSTESLGTTTFEPVDLEANVDDTVKSLQVKETFDATVTRCPPTFVKGVQSLSSGELLPSGIGPAALVTKKASKYKYSIWEEVEKWTQDYCPRFVDVVRNSKPRRSKIVEVDVELKTVLRLPFELQAYVGQSMVQEDATYHKVAITISAKDRLRWNLASCAFRAEVKASKKPAASFGWLPKPKLEEPKSAQKTKKNESEDIKDVQEGKLEDIAAEAHAEEPSPTDNAFQTTDFRAGKDDRSLKDQRDSRSHAPGTDEDDDADCSAPLIGQDPENSNSDSETASPSRVNKEHTAEDAGPPKPMLLSLQTQIEDPKTASFFNVSAFCSRSSNLDFDALESLSSTNDHARSYFAVVVYVVISAISGIYAGIHLALWNHDFPTRAEKIMWKISATTLGVPAAILSILAVFMTFMFYVMLFMTVGQNVGKNKKCIAFFERLKETLGPLGSCLGCFFHWIHLGLQTLGTGLKYVFRGIGTGLRAICKAFVWILRPLWTLLTTAAQAIGKWYQTLDDRRRDENGRVSPLGTFNYCMAVVILPLPLWLAIGALLVAGFALGVALSSPFFAIPGAVVLYFFARGYIVVESFLSLRHVPIGVYQDVSWAQYIPHL